MSHREEVWPQRQKTWLSSMIMPDFTAEWISTKKHPSGESCPPLRRYTQVLRNNGDKREKDL